MININFKDHCGEIFFKKDVKSKSNITIEFTEKDVIKIFDFLLNKNKFILNNIIDSQIKRHLYSDGIITKEINNKILHFNYIR